MNCTKTFRRCLTPKAPAVVGQVRPIPAQIFPSIAGLELMVHHAGLETRSPPCRRPPWRMERRDADERHTLVAKGTVQQGGKIHILEH